MAKQTRLGTSVPFVRTPVQSIPVAVNARYDRRSGVLDMAASADIPADVGIKIAAWWVGAAAAVRLIESAVRVLARPTRPARPARPAPALAPQRAACIDCDFAMFDAEPATAQDLRRLRLSPRRR